MKVVASSKTPVHAIETTTTRINSDHCSPTLPVIQLQRLFRRAHERLQSGRQLHVAGKELIDDYFLVLRSDHTPELTARSDVILTELTFP